MRRTHLFCERRQAGLIYFSSKRGVSLLSVGVIFLKKDKGDFKASLIQAWSFAPKHRSHLLEKMKVDLRILAPSVELRPKRRQCLF